MLSIIESLLKKKKLSFRKKLSFYIGNYKKIIYKKENLASFELPSQSCDPCQT